jgi:TIR domain
MKTFISWSGRRSKAVADALYVWLKDVIQAIDPWISSEEIRKGTRWNVELARELETTHIGVVCLTPENLTAPWLLFEAGALSKLYTEQDAHVCTYLIDMPYTAVTGPLRDFQPTLATEEDTYRLVKSINAAIPEGQGRLTDTELARAFRCWWPELQQCLETLPPPDEDLPPPRQVEDMLQEVLEIVRTSAQSLGIIFESTLHIRRSQINKKFEEIDDALQRLDPEDPDENPT